MGIRSKTARTLSQVLGESGTTRVRQWEARARRRAIVALDVEARNAPTPKERAPRQPSRQERIDALGQQSIDGVVNQETNHGWVSPDPFAEFPKPPFHKHVMLRRLHEVLVPRTYFEIGMHVGASLTLSRARTVGVDPSCSIQKPLHCDLRTYIETSDEFFAREDPFEHLQGVPVDLAFVDGMHLAEFALRDFINLEQHMAPGGVVVMDDVLPRNHLEAYRIRRTGPWSGDVYKVLDVLAEHRPDLTVIPLNTAPTGTVMIVGLDPTSTVLADRYPDIEPTLVTDDPQIVPDQHLRRLEARDPEAMLGLPTWADLVADRSGEPDPDVLERAWQALRDLPRVGA